MAGREDVLQSLPTVRRSGCGYCISLFSALQARERNGVKSEHHCKLASANVPLAGGPEFKNILPFRSTNRIVAELRKTSFGQ